MVVLDRETLPKYTIEEVNQILNGDGERLAYSLGELALRLGMNKRVLTRIIDAKGVPTFFLGNRRMIAADTVKGLLEGDVDASRAIQRGRDGQGRRTGLAVGAGGAA